LSVSLEDSLLAAEAAPGAVRRDRLARQLGRNVGVVLGTLILLTIVVLSILAPVLGTVDPAQIDPTFRNKVPGTERTITEADGSEHDFVYRMGTDSLGRDVYSRVLYGGRVSLTVGLAVAVLALTVGLLVGLVTGYLRWLDAIVMRMMDGLMAIPGILLALTLVALWGAGLSTAILAISVPEIPRVVRLVRSVVLSVREEPYVEAAVALGTPTPLILWRHVLPNTMAPLIVQGTYVAASAILVEAILSFLGVGIPTEVPTWGNIMAEGRMLFRVFPHTIMFPGLFLALTVLAVNILGDGLRDTLDPRLARRL
jgi:peptide/nickel transport system permease protein